jgi:hypothetical protein
MGSVIQTVEIQAETETRQMRPFVQQLFSDCGTASFSRVGSCLALIFSCSWVSRIVWKTGALPPLDGLTLFIVSLYGLGKAGETMQRYFGAKQP